MARAAAGIWQKAAAHTALAISVAVVALLAFTGIGFAAGGDQLQVPAHRHQSGTAGHRGAQATDG